jgi:Zn-dependent protease
MADTMSDPMTWSVSAGRYFGIRVRVHILFLAFIFFQLCEAWAKSGADGLRFTASVSLILFFSILLHEFGHCFAARAIGGEADEVLMWPLGGLAFVSVPRTPRDEFIATVWGPMVDVIICLATGAVLLVFRFNPPWNPFDFWAARVSGDDVPRWLFWTGVAFWLNWVLILFNIVPAFPMDGGRIFRSLLWHRLGHSKATLVAVQVGKVSAIIMGIVGLLADKNLLLVGVAIFVYVSCEIERRMLEASEMMEDNPFGYDFSQGYTSLAKSAPKVKARQPGFWERWRRRRERIKRQRELDAQREEERRMDEILDKVHREGLDSLTDQERRFLHRASEKKSRSRNRSDD